MPNLFGVTIEQESWARSKLTDAVLHLLAPAGMIDVRVYVRIKPIFVWRLNLPGRRRLVRDQHNLYDRLDALETIFPRYDETNRCTILRRHRLPVHAGRQNRQRIHRFIQTQAFNVWLIKHARGLIW